MGNNSSNPQENRMGRRLSRTFLTSVSGSSGGSSVSSGGSSVSSSGGAASGSGRGRLSIVHPNSSNLLLEAVSVGDVETLRRLVGAGANLEVCSHRQGEEDMRCLHLASWGGHEDLVRIILDSRAEREAVAQGRRAVHWAAVGGHVQVLQVLQGKGCHMAALTSEGSTALHLAADYGNLAAVKWLVQQGLDPGLKDMKGCTATDLARASRHTDICEFLLTAHIQRTGRLCVGNQDAYFASPVHNNRIQPDAATQMFAAATDGDLATLDRLLDEGVDLGVSSTRPGEEGLCPLHIASWGGHAGFARRILESNVDREAEARGRRAVHWAAVGGHVQVLQVLQDKGCHMAALTSEGSTALHLAADYGNLAAVKWLVQQGLDPGLKDMKGCTAKDLAHQARYTDIVDFLRIKEPLPQYEDFTTIKWLGEGSFGQVYIVTKHGKLQVLKAINMGRLAGTLKVAAEQELQLLQTIRHPNIVTYMGGGVNGTDLFILLEYCAGGDLAKLIEQRQQESGQPFPETQIVSWTLSIASALKYLHEKGILHRDLKPHNIFLTRGSKSVKLGDFGLARVTEGEINLPRTMVGSPAYMSPEVANALPYDGKADMWSLGCCLYELATLERGYPYNQVSLPGEFSNGFKDTVVSLLNYDPDKRPSAADLLVSPFLLALAILRR
nr:ankyrin-1-like [Procambarus clarkii]